MTVLFVQDGGFGWSCWKWVVDFGGDVTMSKSYGTRDQAEAGLVSWLVRRLAG